MGRGVELLSSERSFFFKKFSFKGPGTEGEGDVEEKGIRFGVSTRTIHGSLKFREASELKGKSLPVGERGGKR